MLSTIHCRRQISIRYNSADRVYTPLRRYELTFTAVCIRTSSTIERNAGQITWQDDDMVVAYVGFYARAKTQDWHEVGTRSTALTTITETLRVQTIEIEPETTC